ncbi:hypothetical protein LUPAC06_05592 [Micromonospora saelicesensis]|nr:hypothetical protein LUPAC06_05592 [Micromonospora saelicesensis]
MTVLTGVNGAGKSTFIQSLLLARYAAVYHDRDVVPLNGPHGLALGEANEVLHPSAPSQQIKILLRGGMSEYPYVLGVPIGRSLNLTVEQRPDIVPEMFREQGQRFAYLNAERLGPRDQLQVTAEDSKWLGVGEQGQYTAQVLAAMGSSVIREPLRHPEKTAEHGVTTLRTQVEDWIEEIIRPIRVDAQWPAGLSASIIRFSEQGWLGEPIRPANMGFGFSYALPIVVAGLLMPSDGMLIVENPEAHLHPAGQSRLGRFLARVAGSGTQVIVETHSDHMINGIRLGVAADHSLGHEDTLIHFFEEATGDGNPVQVELSPRGELTSWPEGFFDQIEEDLGRLARAKRGIH